MAEILKVKFGGKELTAPLSGKNCVYFETAIFFEKNFSTSTGHYHSEDYFYADIDGKKTEMRVPPARLYLKPTYEKEYRPEKAPPEIRKILENIFSNKEMPEKVMIKEWCLLLDRAYLLKIRSETFYLPPLKGETEPQEDSYTSYEITDAEYSEEEKKKYRTPASYWTGG